MKRLVIIILGLSLIANAWLLLRPVPVSVRTIPVPVVAARPVPPVAVESTRSGLTLLAKNPASDLERLRDQLRRAGVDESTIRGVIEGMLRTTYRERLTAWQVEQQAGWWRGTANPLGNAGEPARMMRTLVLEPLEKLLGRDPLDLADTEQQFDFVSADKRRLLAQITLDYADIRSRLREATAGGIMSAETRAELEAYQKVQTERRADVLAALSPAELAEYDLHFSFSGGEPNARRLAAMESTEAEYRAIKPILDSLDGKLKAIPRNALNAASIATAQQDALDRLVEAVGYDRALDLFWNADTTGISASVVDTFRAAGLPAHDATRLFQLAAEAGERAVAVHYDPALTADQKREALLAIQQSIRPQYEALVPSALQAKLPEQVRGWYGLLGEGQYQAFRGSIISGWGAPTPQTVTTPPRGARLTTIAPRRR